MEIIGKGADGVIYFDGKDIFKHIVDKGRRPYFEALRLRLESINRVYRIPLIEEIYEEGDELIVKKEYVRGKALGEALTPDEKGFLLLDKMAELQTQINSTPINIETKFSHAILSAIGKIDFKGKEKAISELQGLDERFLCHGDFHPFNILKDGEQLTAIDWDNACVGNPDMDAARTYLLLEMKMKGIGEMYLDLYCKRKGASKDNIKKMVGLVAIQFLNEPADCGNKDYLYSLIEKHCSSYL